VKSLTNVIDKTKHRSNFKILLGNNDGKMLAPDKAQLIESEADRVYRLSIGWLSATADRWVW
jgi:hypothetical protein